MYTTFPDIIEGILKMFCEMAETEICFLSADQTCLFMRTCLHLVEQYQQVHKQRIEISQKNGLQKIVEEENYSDLETLLILLTHLVDKDTCELSSDAINFAADACLHGLSILLPLLTHSSTSQQNKSIEPFNQYPKLSALFFDLLSECIGGYAEKFKQLQPHVKGTFLEVIREGIKCTSVSFDIPRQAIQTLGILARFHKKKRRHRSNFRKFIIFVPTCIIRLATFSTNSIRYVASY